MAIHTSWPMSCLVKEAFLLGPPSWTFKTRPHSFIHYCGSQWQCLPILELLDVLGLGFQPNIYTYILLGISSLQEELSKLNSWPCQRLLPHQVRICLICDLYMWVCHFVFNTIWSITSSRDFLWYLLYWVNNCGNYFYFFFLLFFFFFFVCFFELQQIGYE